MTKDHYIYGNMLVMRRRLEYAINHTYREALAFNKKHKMGILPRDILMNCLMNIVVEQMKDSYMRGLKAKKK